MSETVVLIEDNKFGFGFTDGDEYSKRNIQNGDDSQYRHLTEDEKSILISKRNYADDWNNILVKNGFRAECVTGSSFYGKVRIGNMGNCSLRFHDLTMPVGIHNSFIISSDIGDNCSVYEVKYLANYIIRDCCMLQCVNEIQTTNHSKFGNGTIKEGEDPSVRVSIDVMNENTGRLIYPFENMQVADAYIGANWPENKKLQNALMHMTDKECSKERGFYGEVGDHSVIKNVGIIKDVKIGPYSYIKGATKLKNLTILSCKEETTQIGENCDLVNGIIGYGSRIFYGCKAVRFVIGEKASLKYGARLINSYLGDNSTVSCCEVLSNLIFPFHEQHHNNSFLISSLLMGQSNMAAGANIGSNHNSRSADCELKAGRGFWPALSSTIKFDSRFASFTIIAKGNYYYELNIKPPFALLSDNQIDGRRELMPAYWWMYNMYALERNNSKFKARDRRLFAKQHIETDYLAPDTAWEILDGMRLLCKWTATSLGYDPVEDNNILETGREILTERQEELSGHEVLAMRQEHSKSRVKILKPIEAYNSYRTMLIYYGTKEIVSYCFDTGTSVRELLSNRSNGVLEFTNMGGQLVPTYKVNKLISDIENGTVNTWNQVHDVYDTWYREYPLDKALNAVKVLEKVLMTDDISKDVWDSLIEKLKETRAYIDDQVFKTREKDYRNKFRMCTYRSTQERDAVIGKIEDNSFINETKQVSVEIIGKASKVKY